MSEIFSSASQSVRWAALVEAAKRGAEKQGYSITREPGRGLSNIWKLEKDGKVQLGAIRTSQDRWFAFPPQDGGNKWKTLDEVDVVILAVVDSPEDPKRAEVYIFPKDEVRQRFAAAYSARIDAGHVQKDSFGMWVGLDIDTRGIASSVGSGIVERFKPVAVYSLVDLLSANSGKVRHAGMDLGDDDPDPQRLLPTTIAEVMQWAKERVAEIAGVRVDSIRLELKLES